VLNTFGEHGFQDVFKKMVEALAMVRMRGRWLLQGWWWSVGPKFFFFTRWQHRPPLWSSGQSSWLQIRRPGFDSRHYQKKQKKK
jgi:hypothetical protein